MLAPLEVARTDNLMVDFRCFIVSAASKTLRRCPPVLDYRRWVRAVKLIVVLLQKLFDMRNEQLAFLLVKPHIRTDQFAFRVD